MYIRVAMGVAGYVYTLSLSKITKACVEHVHDSLPSTVSATIQLTKLAALTVLLG